MNPVPWYGVNVDTTQAPRRHRADRAGSVPRQHSPLAQMRIRAVPIGCPGIRNADTSCSSGSPNLYNFTPLNRSALAMTETELKLIAAAAIMGLSRIPKNG